MVPKKIIILLLIALLPQFLLAQENWQVVRGDCMPEQSMTGHRAGRLKLPTINNQWDPERVYHQLVILINFCDKQFLNEDPKTLYERILNEPGYNEGNGPGCMADYYREQSNGLFNLQFDVYGPYEVSQKEQPYENPTSSTRNYGRASFIEATNELITENPEMDFSPYDWNGDGYIEQVVYVYAGMPGNLGSISDGHIWPNTSSMTSIKTHDGHIISNYTASGEYWPYSTPVSCGIGTICHEFNHSLGLPDIYPTNSWCFSVCDEWDLMDGGNFTNYGWCPPNFTPIEKMLLGWLTPIKLTKPVSIVNLKPVSEGGEVYIADYCPYIENPGDEEQPSEARAAERINACVLIENRQNTLWDAGAPGSGLMIWYLDYDESAWRNNAPNNKSGYPRFRPVYADGLDYNAWKSKLSDEGITNPYQNKKRMNSLILSTSPFPFGENNAVEECQISNITINDEGYASFDFMGGASGIKDVRNEKGEKEFYDLLGRRIENPIHGQLYLVRGQKGIIRKQVY